MQKKQNYFLYGLCCMVALLFCFSGCESQEEELLLTQETEQDERTSQETAEPSEEEEPKEKTKICVDLGGAVATPGVYFLAEGSRLYQAVEMAGGFTENAASEALNQAQILTDGQQIRVPTQEEVLSQPELLNQGGTENAAMSGSAEGKVNINTAGTEELMNLNGIGEARAQAIIAYREEQGAFQSPEQIMEVSGIGEGIYSKIKEQIVIE